MHNGRRRVLGRMALAVGMVGMSVAGLVPGGPGGVVAPAGAATTTLRNVRTIDVGLDTYHTPTGSPEYFSSPATADLDGDLQPDLVVAAPNGTITATRITTGARMWQRDLGATAIQASPVVTDVDNDGKVDVVAATMDGRVVLLDGQTGGVVRTFRQGAPQFCPAGQDCRPDGFFATPVVADVNGDGRNDIVAASYDHSVYAWSHGGTLLWRSFLYDTLWSSPAVADIDNNGTQEIILGGDIYAGNPLGLPAGGLLWVLNGRNGTRFSGYPRSIPGQVVWSSPAVVDLNGDNRLEAVFGTGNHGPFGDGAAARRVWAVTLPTRANLSGWPVGVAGRVVHQPAIGDVDNDGKPDVVVATETGYLQAFRANGSALWSTCNAASTTACGGPVGHGGVVIADVDDDGIQEVVSALSQNLRVYGLNRELEATFRLTGNGTLNPASIAAITEVNGSAMIVQSSLYRVGGHGGQARAGDVVRTNLLTTDEALCRQDWPAFKRSAYRTSVKPAREAWHPFPCARPFVSKQYQDVLGRELDATGREFWTHRLRTTWSGARVIEAFMNSPEFLDVAAPIVRVHLGLKGGPPLPSSEIRAQMAAGRQGQTLAQLAEELVDQSQYDGQPAGTLVDAVYPRLWGAAPTAQQRQAAIARIEQAGPGTWLAELASTDWVEGRLKGRVQVAMTYIALLDRGPDRTGWDYWVAQTDRGVRPQRLIAQFLNTPEYQARVL